MMAPFVSELDAEGVQTDLLLTQAGLDRDLLGIPATRIARQQLWNLTALAMAQEGIGDLGLRAALRSGFEELGPIGRRIFEAPTLHAAIDRMTGELRQVSSHIDLVYESRGESGWLRRGDRSATYPAVPASEQYILVLMLDVVRRAMGRSWQPETVYLHHALPESSLERLEIEDTRIVVGRRGTAIELPPELLVQTISRPESAAVFVTENAEAPVPHSLKGSLRVALRPLIGRVPLSIERVADIASMSPRSLQRQLASEGASWSSILDDLRYEIAAVRLSDPATSIRELAHDLGYSSQAHFTRAFKRWTGLPPSAYRRKLPDVGATDSRELLVPLSSGPGAG
jgi:AraC-like DNA-binding protein